MSEEFIRDIFNYGVPTVLLFLVGFGLWKLGNRITDAAVDLIQRQAATSERLAASAERHEESLARVSDLIVTISQTAATTHVEMQRLSTRIKAHCDGFGHLVDGAIELAADNPRIVQHFQDARRKSRGE